jgi:hypothetical protein
VNEQPVTEQTASPATPAELTPQDQAILSGLAAGRARHKDFDIMLPLMDSLARAFFPNGAPPDWSQVSPEDFVEALYVMARFASFSEVARQLAFAEASQPQVVM